MKRISCTVFLLIFSLICSLSYALEVETHEAINEQIARNNINGFSLDTFLKNQLGIQGGIEENFKDRSETQKAWRWVSFGGRYEDKPPENTIPYRRSRNHFHDPTKQWDQAHYSDWFAFCSRLDNPFLISGHCPDSAILWAQGPQITDDWFSPGGDWSWKRVREFYYTALTGKDSNGDIVAANKAERDTYFAKTFRGLGQLMHLVQDMSVPEHARNDFHAFGGYEGWLKTAQSGKDLRRKAIFDNALANAISYDPSILAYSADNPQNPLATSPIAKIFDTDKYKGTQVTLDITRSTAVGLAEFTNANFFSENTISSSKYPFPTTDVQDYTVCKDTAPERARAAKRWYIGKGACPQDAQQSVDHYLVASFLPSLRPDKISVGMMLDDKVYEDYARQLLPRAVGYSAGLLKYFFRGQLALAHIDENNVKVYNYSEEPLESGVIELYWDDTADVRQFMTSYVITAPILPGQATEAIAIYPPSDDLAKRPGRYWVVFKGKLGGEEGAVIGDYRYYWTEEWDNGPTGNHPWLYADTDLVNENPYPPNGKSVNIVENGNIKMTNIRYAGTRKAHVNQALIGDAYKKPTPDPTPYCTNSYQTACFANDFGWEFPIFIDNRTWLVLKIDAMSTNVPIAAPSCVDSTWPVGEYQRIHLAFKMGNGVTKHVEFTAGHPSKIFPAMEIPLGEMRAYYLYNILKQLGPVIEPVSLQMINVIQQMVTSCETTQQEHVQYMEVDHIGLFDGVIYDGPTLDFPINSLP